MWKKLSTPNRSLEIPTDTARAHSSFAALTGALPGLLLLLGLAGVGVIWYSTRWGAGLMDDAFIYIMAAKNLVAGNGLVWPWGDGQLRPMTYFPPMFPFTLAAFELFGADAVAAARLVNALAFGANVILAGLIARRITRSWPFALLGALLFLTSDVLIEVHAWAMSEPLYLLFTLSGLLLLGVYLERGSRAWLAASAVALGLGFLTRYIGFSLLLTGGTVLLFYTSRGEARERARYWVDILIFGLVSLLPMALWMLRSLSVTGAAIDRSPGWRLVTLQQLQKGANTLLIWFFPGRLIHGREFLALAVLAVLLGLAFFGLRRLSRAERPGAGLRMLLGAQVIFHILVLLTSKSFFEPTTPLNDRILSPALPSLLLLLVAWLSDLWQAIRGANRLALAARLAVLAFCVLFAGFYLFRASSLVPRLHASGLGFARKVWHSSETMQAIREMPQTPLYSNSPSAIYMWTGRPAYPIYDLGAMRTSLLEDDASLVVFKSISVELYDVSMDDLTQGLTLVNEFKDGAIYRR